MFKAIKITVLLALFASVSAFASNTPASTFSTEPENCVEEQVVNLQVVQIAGTTNISITWNTNVTGPYQVDVGNITAPPFFNVSNQVVNVTNAQVNNLTVGNTYRVRVTDSNSNAIKDITIN